MANVLSSIQVITGTTGTGHFSDHSFSGGTNLSQMFHFVTYDYNTADNLHDQVFRRSELTSTSNLRLDAGQTGGGNQDLNFTAFIIIYTAASDMEVDRYSAATDSATNNVTIAAVSATAQTFVIPHGEEDTSDTSIGFEELFAYGLTSTTNVQIQVDQQNNSTNLVNFEVVDWGNTDITVQHINFQQATSTQATDTATITAVELARTWLIGTGRTDSGSANERAGEMVCRFDLQSTTLVRMRRGLTGAQWHWSCQIIEDTSDSVWQTQIGNINMGTSDTTGTFTLSAVDTARTFAIGTATTQFGFCGSIADTSTGNADNAHCNVELTDSTTITVTRGVTDSAAMDIFVQSIDFDGSFPAAGRNRLHVIG